MEDKKSQAPSKIDGDKKPAVKQGTANQKNNMAPNKSAGQRRGNRRPFKRQERPVDDFEQKIVDLARVTRVMAGGKRMKFRACMIVGDKKGKVGIGISKGVDVSMAISKAVGKAKKKMIDVPIIDGTVPHEVNIKLKSARIMIKPAKKGSGIKAGGVMRIVLELAGIKDVVAKILGTNNKVNNAKAVLLALESFVPSAVERAKRETPKKFTPKVAPVKHVPAKPFKKVGNEKNTKEIKNKK